MDLRSNFSSSRLVRLLGERARLDLGASGPDFAERLSLWLNAFDAIGLHAAHQAIQAQGEGSAPKVRRPKGSALRTDLQRVRSGLVTAIMDQGAGTKRAGPALVQADPEAKADYAPYQQRYLEQQRQMALRISALRAHVRQAVAAASGRLRQLATLDAVLEQMLGEREQKLLASVPALLERRFRELREAQQGEDSASWRQPGGWLEVFGREWRELLLAELELRLQPVEGLMQAFDNEEP